MTRDAPRNPYDNHGPEFDYVIGVSTDDLDLVRHALDSGVPVDAPLFGHGATALIRAVGKSEELVNLLIERGARVDAEDREGVTPLQVAVVGGSAHVVRTLLKHGVDPTRRLRFGRPQPLEVAVREGHDEIARLLQEYIDTQGSRWIMNPLKDALDVLEAHNHRPEEVLWVGSKDFWFMWEEFAEVADRDYGDRDGRWHVAHDLTICGEQWMAVRDGHAGNAWWEVRYIPPPWGMARRPELHRKPTRLVGRSLQTLSEMQREHGADPLAEADAV
jgi:hypothetical protein